MRRRVFPFLLFSVVCALSVLACGCATLSEFTGQAERTRQEKEELEKTVGELELREAELEAENQNLKVEISGLKESKSNLFAEIERLREEKAELERRLVSSREHQKKLEGELEKADERLGEIIDERSGELAELDGIKDEFSSVLKGYSGVTVERRAEGVAVILHGILTLRTGKITLKSESFPIMDKLVEVLGKYPARRIKISGHTDDIPISVKYPSNWELSVARALAVLHYFEKKGIDSMRMSVTGYGEYMPEDTNTTPEGRARNRRVEILVR